MQPSGSQVMPCCGSQSNASKPEPSSRQTVPVPFEQLVAPGTHWTQPSVSTRRPHAEARAHALLDRVRRSRSLLGAALPSQTIAIAPLQDTRSSAHCSLRIAGAAGAAAVGTRERAAAVIAAGTTRHAQQRREEPRPRTHTRDRSKHERRLCTPWIALAKLACTHATGYAHARVGAHCRLSEHHDPSAGVTSYARIKQGDQSSSGTPKRMCVCTDDALASGRLGKPSLRRSSASG